MSANPRVLVPKGLFPIGVRLSHDIYDRSGELLLRSGSLVDTPVAVELIEKNGYLEADVIDDIRTRMAGLDTPINIGYRPDYSGEAVSAIRMVTSARDWLVDLFARPEGGLREPVAEIAALVLRCSALDGDAALCNIHVKSDVSCNVRQAINVASLAAMLLARVGTNEARVIAAVCAALTMNLGDLELHHDLFFQEGEVSEAQRARIRAHPKAGVDALLARGVQDPLWLAIVAQHHEAVDGSGYPSGLTAGKILPEALAVSIADRYCAMVSQRAHREAMLPPVALREIHTRHAKAVGPEWVAALVKSTGIYPPGSFVRLVNGEVAIVVKRLLDPKSPVVYSVVDAHGDPLGTPRKRLVGSQPQLAIREPVAQKDVRAPIDLERFWPPTRMAAAAET